MLSSSSEALEGARYLRCPVSFEKHGLIPPVTREGARVLAMHRERGRRSAAALMGFVDVPITGELKYYGVSDLNGVGPYANDGWAVERFRGPGWMPKFGDEVEIRQYFRDEAWFWKRHDAYPQGVTLKVEPRTTSALVRVEGLLSTQDLWIPFSFLGKPRRNLQKTILDLRREAIARVSPRITRRILTIRHQRCLVSVQNNSVAVRCRRRKPLFLTIPTNDLSRLDIVRGDLILRPPQEQELDDDAWSETRKAVLLRSIPIDVAFIFSDREIQIKISSTYRSDVIVVPRNDLAWLTNDERTTLCDDLLSQLNVRNGRAVLGSLESSVTDDLFFADGDLVDDGTIVYRGLQKRWLCVVRRTGHQLTLTARHVMTGISSTRVFSSDDWLGLGRCRAPLPWLSKPQLHCLARRLVELGLDDPSSSDLAASEDLLQPSAAAPAPPPKIDDDDDVDEVSKVPSFLKQVPKLEAVLLEKKRRRLCLGNGNVDCPRGKFVVALIAEKLTGKLATRVAEMVAQDNAEAVNVRERLDKGRAAIEKLTGFPHAEEDASKFWELASVEKKNATRMEKLSDRLATLTEEVVAQGPRLRELAPEAIWVSATIEAFRLDETVPEDNDATRPLYTEEERLERMAIEAAVTKIGATAVHEYHKCMTARTCRLKALNARLGIANFVVGRYHRYRCPGILDEAQRAANGLRCSFEPTLFGIIDCGDAMKFDDVVIPRSEWATLAGPRADEHWALTDPLVRRQLARRVKNWGSQKEPIAVTAAIVRRARATPYVATLLDAGAELLVVGRFITTDEEMWSRMPSSGFPLLAGRIERQRLLHVAIQAAALKDRRWGLTPSQVRDPQHLHNPNWFLPTWMTVPRSNSYSCL